MLFPFIRCAYVSWYDPLCDFAKSAHPMTKPTLFKNMVGAIVSYLWQLFDYFKFCTPPSTEVSFSTPNAWR